MSADLGIVGMLKTPKNSVGILTFLTIRRRSAARNVGIVKETVRNTDIWDIAQKHWIVDLSQSQVILTVY